MIKFFKQKIKKNLEIFGLVTLILISVIYTSYYNYNKKNNNKNYNSFVDNVFFKKTLVHIFNNLDPKYSKVKHKIKSGETFDKILSSYLINKKEIIKIKETLKK